jgi:ferrous iron transport protein B
VWTTLLGYGTAVLFYQAARFGEHPAYSTWWIVGISAAFVAVFWAMRYLGKRDNRAKTVIVPGV